MDKDIMQIVVFTMTVIGAAVKYGMDMQKLKSENDLQNLAIKHLEKELQDEKLHNEKQHEEFYVNKNDTIELKQSMKFIVQGVEEIKLMLRDGRK